MEYSIIFQIIIALAILNVWILRFRKPTQWRGGDSKNMKDEFKVYGLPSWLVTVVGFLKITLALLLIAGVWFPFLTEPSAAAMSLLMLGAITMHIKVKDQLKKSFPAIFLLLLCLIVIFF